MFLLFLIGKETSKKKKKIGIKFAYKKGDYS